MKYWKIMVDGYIHAVQRGGGGTHELTREEYEHILAIIQACPEAPEGFAYRLKDDLAWELYELPAEADASSAPDPVGEETPEQLNTP